MDSDTQPAASPGPAKGPSRPIDDSRKRPGLRRDRPNRNFWFALMLLLSIAPVVTACGLRPLYGGASSPARQTLGAVEVGGIPGRAGYLMRGALEQRLAAAGRDAPRYRLEVTLDDRIEGFGVRADNAVTRERRTLRARFQLLTADLGTVLLDATAGADAGIDVVSSEYATIAAEDSALERLTEQVADQIVARIALYATRRADQRAAEPVSELP